MATKETPQAPEGPKGFWEQLEELEPASGVFTEVSADKLAKLKKRLKGAKDESKD